MVDDADVHARLKKIRLLVADVDGVLTDGGMYYSARGEELKKFNTRDGMGLELIREAGIEVAIITSEHSEIAARRAEKLKINHVYLGIKDKSAALDDLLDRLGMHESEVAYIGDDLNDLPVLERVGFAVTVADGAQRNKSVAHYVTIRRGGEGALRELCDLLIESVQFPRSV